MSDARTAILARMRASMGRKADDAERRAAVAERLGASPRGLIPARGRLDPKERLDLFCRMAEGVQASVARVSSASDIPHAVADYLKEKNLQVAENKRQFIPNKQLAKIFNVKKPSAMTFVEINKHVSHHLTR